MTLRRIDLNLFRVFEAVLRQRSVNGAARELGVTPSAVSHALARLRQALGDELFVQGAAGMEPTARARELAPGIADGLGRIAGAVTAKPFVPAEAMRTFRIAASDYGAVVILSPLVARLSRIAPQVDLRIFPFNRMDVIRQLDDGRVDLVLGWFGEGLPERLRRAAVMVDGEAMVVRAGHPLASGPVTRERLFAYPHIVVELTGTEERATDGFVDERGVTRRVWIERLLMEMGDGEQGLVGRVAVSVPHYAAVPPMLQATDMVATLPRRLALRVAAPEGLVLLDLPYEPLSVTIEAVWHERAERDPGAQWLIAELTAALREAAPA